MSSRNRPTPTEGSRATTIVPPVAAEELASKPEARPTPPGMHAVREAQVTITNEVELERARLASMQMITPLPVASPTEALAGEPADDESLSAMRDKFGLGDFAGALAIAEKLLLTSPNHPEALQTSADCRSTLTELYEGRLGSLDRVPFVVVAREELRWLSIDHRGGFLLSHIDGISSLETILDVSGMPRLDAMRILVELVQKRVVGLR